jgi:hypothetical protein
VGLDCARSEVPRRNCIRIGGMRIEKSCYQGGWANLAKPEKRF